MSSSINKIILQFNKKDYVIDKKLWRDNNPLPDDIVGDARVVVRRGGLLADIPSDVPFGTFCILVNFAALKEE